MTLFSDAVLTILGSILVLAALGVILAKKPVHACLLFLLSLLDLASIYLYLSAEFIAIMQILVYAGAILVIFMFIIILFQDAHEQVSQFPPRSLPILIGTAAFIVVLSLIFLGAELFSFTPRNGAISSQYGSVRSLGHTLYVDFFFPFEAVIFLFLIAVVGALYIARRAD